MDMYDAMADPAVCLVYFGAVLAAVAAAGAAWEHWRGWKRFDEMRRTERLRRRDRAEFLDLVRTYTQLQKPADTFPAEWAKDAA